MVVDMQHGDLVVVLAQDEEEGVHELYEFGEVVPPEDTDNLRGKGQRILGSPQGHCRSELPHWHPRI